MKKKKEKKNKSCTYKENQSKTLDNQITEKQK